MATLHLMVGVPCSGKTTLARRIEQERACLRLTPDEWIERLFGGDARLDVLDAARDPMEALLWEVAAKVLQMGGDVILDFGFWTRAERDASRARAAGLGARCVIHFADVSEGDLLRRLRERNANPPPGSFRIDEERIKDWIKLFEPPSPNELSLGRLPKS
jgi:predicted kinase